MKITLIGRVPSKKNSKIISCAGKRPRLFPSKKYTEWHKDASTQLMVQRVRPMLKENLSATLTFFAPDRRAYDLSNKTESIMDLLVDNGIIIDDNYNIISHLYIHFGGVEKGGRCEIELLEN